MSKEEKTEKEKTEEVAMTVPAQLPAVSAVTDMTSGMLSSIGRLDFDGIMKLCKTLVASGFLPKAIQKPEQAAAIILKGAELDLPPMLSLQSIHVINGTPGLSPQLMLGMCYQRIPGFNAECVESTDEKCVWKFDRPGKSSYTSTFTMDDAKKMGLSGKDNWKKQPGVMLEWRAISKGLKRIAPDIVGGLYTPEELNPDARVINAMTGQVEMVEADYSMGKQIENAPDGATINMRSNGKKAIAEPEQTPEVEPGPCSEGLPEGVTIEMALATLDVMTGAQRKLLAKKAGLDPMAEDLMASDSNVVAMYMAHIGG